MTMPLVIREVHVQHEIIFIQLWGTEVVQNILRRQENSTGKTINMIIISQKTFSKDKKQDVEYFKLKHMWKHAVIIRTSPQKITCWI